MKILTYSNYKLQTAVIYIRDSKICKYGKLINGNTYKIRQGQFDRLFNRNLTKLKDNPNNVLYIKRSILLYKYILYYYTYI